MAGRLGSMAVRSISAADVLNQGQWFNWVWRDKTQVDNGNAEDAFHPLIQEGVAHIPATNRLGLPIFNSFEYGEELNFMFEPSVDVAHKGSGHGNHPDLFPNTLDIIDILDKRGFKLPVNDKQIQAIESLDETFREVDKEYAAFAIPTTVFTCEQ